MTFAFGGQHSIQLSYGRVGCIISPPKKTAPEGSDCFSLYTTRTDTGFSILGDEIIRRLFTPVWLDWLDE